MSVITSREKLKRLTDYYKEKGLLIVGLNDSQGVNITTTFFRKGLLDYLAAALTSDELQPEVINAFSLLMNKTEHIDYFLKSNLTLEEIKLSQVYSAVSALEKVMLDGGLPKCFGKLGNAYKIVYPIQDNDKNIYLTDSLVKFEEPTVIYSSGVNNLMREVGNNPFGIKGDYRARDKKPNYYYTFEKAKDPTSLDKVIDGIDRNFYNILSINNNTDIYALGAYVPKSLQSEEMDIFRDLVIRYNQKLESLCNRYNITFINTEIIGKRFNNSKNNFHISTAGHNNLANHILGYMYYNKIENSINKSRDQYDDFEVTNNGALDLINLTSEDGRVSYDSSLEFTGYTRERQMRITEEHQRENEVFQKVLNMSSRFTID